MLFQAANTLGSWTKQIAGVTNIVTWQECADSQYQAIFVPPSDRGTKRVVRACFMLRVTGRFCEAKFQNRKIDEADGNCRGTRWGRFTMVFVYNCEYYHSSSESATISDETRRTFNVDVLLNRRRSCMTFGDVQHVVW